MLDGVDCWEGVFCEHRRHMTGSPDVLTIGHSDMTADQFLARLKHHGVNALGDVRSVPFSRRFPWFSGRSLAERLRTQGLVYIALGDRLGGRPTDRQLYCDGIADYETMATTDRFRSGLDLVVEEAKKRRICLMCAEREPLDCHRCLLVGRVLAGLGCSVGHILGDGSVESHAATEVRLIAAMGGGPDLFGDRDRRLAEAYRARARRTAARLVQRGRATKL